MDIADALYKLEESSEKYIGSLSNFEVYSFLSDYVWSDLHIRKSLQTAFKYIEKYDLRFEIFGYFGSFSRGVKKTRKKFEKILRPEEINDFRRALYITVFIENYYYFDKHSMFFFVNEYGRK